MSEALDFVKNFEDLLKSNEEEQRKTNSLKSVKEALGKEVAELLLKKKRIEQQIEEKLIQCDKDILERKENAERNFEAERARLAKLSSQLETQKIELEQRETSIRQRESELNERERLLSEKGHKLGHKEVDLNAKAEQIKKDNQAIASANMEISKQLQSIDEELKGIAQAKQGIESVRAELKNQQSILRDAEEQLRLDRERAEDDKKEIVKTKKDLELIQIKLSEESKRFRAESFILDKQRKDNTDKENALKAMQVELDFKIAKYKRENLRDG